MARKKARTYHQQIAATAKVLMETYLIRLVDSGRFDMSEEFLRLCGFEWWSDRRVPPSPGIYAIYVSESRCFDFKAASCLYVGKSINLASRISEHQFWVERVAQDFESMSIAFKSLDLADLSRKELDRELLLKESLIIGLLRPAFNFDPSLRGSGN